MKLLVLGGSGMLGHMLANIASVTPGISVTATGRSTLDISSLTSGVISTSFDAGNLTFDAIDPLFSQRFDYCVNCIGAVKQLKNISAFDMYYLNFSFPSALSNICKLYQTRLIHVSTDCVFVGDRGNYLETETPDAHDAYGHSKFLGEQIADSALVLRTSIVGPELNGSRQGLLGWFLGETSSVMGHTQAYFSGLTTLCLSEFIIDLIQRSKWESGLFHVAGPKISKFDLLKAFNLHFGLNTHINGNETLKIDRSLVNGLVDLFGYRLQSWDEMLRSLVLHINSKDKK